MLAQAPASHPLLIYTPTEHMDKQLTGQSREVEARHPLLIYTPTEYMDKQLKGQSREIVFFAPASYPV